MSINQKGQKVVEEQIFLSWDSWNTFTDQERNTAIALLCEHLGVEIWRTNATSSGNVELELRKGTP
jgi:hypothetical protein